MGYLYDIGVFIVVLGELVFFHELGHFVAAKACGIYCERFSLGMPPRLFGFKYGETDYCIGLLPIGGYVKMAGQEDVPLSDDERKEQYGSIPPDRWFMNKPVWQRVIVIVAGPLMNIVLAVLLYAIIVGYGAPTPEAKHDSRIGIIEPESPARTALLYAINPATGEADFSKEPDAVGWKTGDRITSINGNPITNIMDVRIDAVLSGGQSVVMEIERKNADGTVSRFLSPVTPQKIGDDDQLRFGIGPYTTALVDVVRENMPAAAAGIKKGDVITHLNGEPIDALTFIETVSAINDGKPVELTVESDTGTRTVTVTPNRIGRFKDVAFTAPLDWAEFVDDTKPLLVAESDLALLEGSGFNPGDTITSINGESVTSGAVRKLVTRPADEKLQLVIERKGTLGFGTPKQIALPDVTVNHVLQAVTPFDINAQPVIDRIKPELAKATGLQEKDIIEEIDGKPATLALMKEIQSTRIGKSVPIKVKKPAIGYGVMRGETTKDATLEISAVGIVGIVWGERMVFYRAPLARILPEAWAETWKMVKLTYRTLKTLVTGGLSTKELGGPLMIYQATTNAARIGGMVGLLETTAFISVNLAIFNLLPLPVLDGGHLFFLAIEGIRRKPVSARVMEWVQQAGLVLIIGLMLFVTFNDIRRWIDNLVP